MAHNAYIAAPGSFVTGFVLNQAAWELLNTQLYKAANFDDGGSWSPAMQVNIGGAGVNFQGSGHQVDSLALFTWDGDLDFNGTMSCAGQITINAATGQLLLLGTKKVELTARPITRVLGLPTIYDSGLGPVVGAVSLEPWQVAGYVLTTANVAGVPKCCWELDIPHGATITAALVSINGPTHANFTNVTLPTLYLVYSDMAGTLTTVSTTTDPSATVGAYDAQHSFGPTGLATVVDRTTKRYYLMLHTESGSAAAAGTTVLNASVTFSTAAYDDGAG